jgi:hypothetical protein
MVWPELISVLKLISRLSMKAPCLSIHPRSPNFFRLRHNDSGVLGTVLRLYGMLESGGHIVSAQLAAFPVVYFSLITTLSVGLDRLLHRT